MEENIQKKAIKKLLNKINKGEIIIKDSCRIFRRNKNGKTKHSEYLSTYGYYRTSVNIDGKPIFVMSHRLIYAYHYGIENLDESMTIHHIDHNKTNNVIDNLEQVTRQDNAIEGNVYHRNNKPSVNRVRKLKDNSLMRCNIERLIKRSNYTKEYIANKLGISSNQLRYYERQKCFVPMDKAFILADLLGVKVDDLYERE